MAPSNGSTASVPHTAVAGVVTDDPRTFYPYCSAGDFSKSDARYATAELAEADAEMQAHLTDAG